MQGSPWFIIGAYDFQAGVPFKDCPLNDHTVKKNEWRRGWRAKFEETLSAQRLENTIIQSDAYYQGFCDFDCNVPLSGVYGIKVVDERAEWKRGWRDAYAEYLLKQEMCPPWAMSGQGI